MVCFYAEHLKWNGHIFQPHLREEMNSGKEGCVICFCGFHI
jgi:hypothetical protein